LAKPTAQSNGNEVDVPSLVVSSLVDEVLQPRPTFVQHHCFFSSDHPTSHVMSPVRQLKDGSVVGRDSHPRPVSLQHLDCFSFGQVATFPEKHTAKSKTLLVGITVLAGEVVRIAVVVGSGRRAGTPLGIGVACHAKTWSVSSGRQCDRTRRAPFLTSKL
jgi:hypothetical protein